MDKVISEGDGRKEALSMALQSIEKQFGKGAIMSMGADSVSNVEMIPTGIISLDLALGGGVPRGRIIEIFGPESSGKTSLATTIIAQIQRNKGVAAFIDAEHAFDSEYGKKLGIDLDSLLISQPDTGEQALEITETLVRSNAVDIIVIDSVAALVPRAEIEGEMGDAMMGVQARLMSQALRKLTAAISKSKTIVIFINQIRMKIGVMFGNPETTTGGNALKFYSSIRMDIRRREQLKQGEEIVGGHHQVKVVKNKVAPPFRIAEFDIMYNEGISKEGDLIDTGIKLGVVEKAGAWLSFNGEKIGQGKEAAREFLKEHKDIALKIHNDIWSKVKEQA
ncbi:MAG: Protein RecA [Candidatus Gottesmanbacteria bacterium GW2011_GWC2_39_8]|uniref:Protein RecA n=2 Tax=Bacteria candidate phyla TaxID=1783234 RepID=A0A0G0T515_9BACT|nr:MAG: Protein RecA [Candidatus Gottesmanbacteria bacterium GW2011_GWC2_39_8]